MEKSDRQILVSEGDIDQIKMLSDRAEKSSTDGLESYEKLEASIENIFSKSNDISESIGKIENIILQTKILSLNASVEAERAGEHGRGFAVIAKEMGILAEEIKNNVIVVEKYSKEIVSRVGETAGVAELTKEKIEISEMSSQLANQFINGINIQYIERTKKR